MSKSARNFVFTYNLRSPTVARSFIADAEGFVKAGHLRGIIFQLEIAPTSGQHHFQGYLELPKPQRISALHKLFEGHALHYEDRRGTRDQAVEYSTKEDTRGPAVDPDDEEAWPAAGPYAFPNREFFAGSKQGERSDLKRVYDFIEEHFAKHKRVTYGDVLAEFPAECMRYKAGISAAITVVANRTTPLEDVQLKPWQHDLLVRLSEDPHPRAVMWYWDERGNTGKSWFAKFLVANYSADYYSGGKATDIVHACNGARIQVFDFTRSNEGFVSYDAIERLKNGLVFSPKYDSQKKVFDVPHVLIFANFEPDRAKLSADRWDVTHIATI